MNSRLLSTDTTIGSENTSTQGSSEASSNFREQEYETQFFGFTPQSFCDGIYNAMLEHTWDRFQEAQKELHSEFRHLVSNEQGQKASAWFMKRLIAALDRTFDKLEVYLFTNVLHIPNNVVLPEDMIQMKNSYSKEDEEAVDAELLELRQKIRAAKYVNASLRQDIKDLDKVQAEFYTLHQYLNTLEKVCKDAGLSDVKDSLVFVTDHAMRVQNILDKIEPLLPPPTKKPKLEDGVTCLTSVENQPQI